MRLTVEPLTPERYAPFGWVLGIRPPEADPTELYETATIEFWHEHTLDPGEGGATEYLWVHFKPRAPVVTGMESHLLTEQAIVPVTGVPLVHVVAPPPDAGTPPAGLRPRLEDARAFLLDGTLGVCMRAGTWHAQLALEEATTHLMVTRRSTTVDLLTSLAGDGPDAARETVLVRLDEPVELEL